VAETLEGREGVKVGGVRGRQMKWLGVEVLWWGEEGGVKLQTLVNSLGSGCVKVLVLSCIIFQILR
jgi:hypothetical protein